MGGMGKLVCPCSSVGIIDQTSKSKVRPAIGGVNRPPIRYRDALTSTRKERMGPTEQWIALLLIGLAIGIISGMLGIGGGILVIPALVFFFSFPHRKAV